MADMLASSTQLLTLSLLFVPPSATARSSRTVRRRRGRVAPIHQQLTPILPFLSRPETKHFVYFYLGQIAILLWKSS